jgi:hypothetical protein
MSATGTCPVCQHTVPLATHGTIRPHSVNGVVLTKPRQKRWKCTGSGRWPAGLDDITAEAEPAASVDWVQGEQ